ncbi:hypothetical protein PACTADRAFT_47660 [Pachysolen tannophilus NRRL Y-2460]|uniref:Uncharacterized protein n=1 Tax=Pachysolen tannophilus NRRL Y-2460 TaxID=669874 RepID=A0A1E4U1M8_PACTA|nr:hypothetical protein PACTADRAFT_47660 [Pachysolen tannophilus NRRL Y-2460]
MLGRSSARRLVGYRSAFLPNNNRYFHLSFFWLNSKTNQESGNDSLSRQKLKLKVEDPLLEENAKQYKFPQFEDSGAKNESSQSEFNKRYELVERMKALIFGIVCVGGVIGIYQAYQYRSQLKYLLFHEYDLSAFKESYEELQRKKNKSKKQEFFMVTNKNDTSVPGLYVCGNNEYYTLDPKDRETKAITKFKRFDFFDGKFLKDLKISKTSGAAIDENGNLYQWGKGFDNDATEPRITLQNQKLSKVTISNQALYLLTERGEVLYIPESFENQLKISSNPSIFKKIGFFKSKPILNFSKLQIPNIAKDEKITDFQSGLQHLLLLTNKGRVFSLATGFKPIDKSYGQFGLPTLSQFDPVPPPNKVFELKNLNTFKSHLPTGEKTIENRFIKQIACGDNHSLALDNLGSIWAWGKNTFGSLGKNVNYDTEIIPFPSKIDLVNDHFKRNELPQCIDIHAGGDSSFATFTSTDIYNLFQKSLADPTKLVDMKNLTSNQKFKLLYLSWGHGLNGELGVGHFIHAQADPLKIKNLADLKDFNENTNVMETIGIKHWSTGQTHTALTLNNNDVLVWGSNEFGQLGNGKRIKVGAPATVPKIVEPLNESTENAENKKYAKTIKMNNDRLQLLSNVDQKNSVQFKNLKGKKINKDIEQVLVAGDESSAIYYRKL